MSRSWAPPNPLDWSEYRRVKNKCKVRSEAMGRVSPHVYRGYKCVWCFKYVGLP